MRIQQKTKAQSVNYQINVPLALHRLCFPHDLGFILFLLGSCEFSEWILVDLSGAPEKDVVLFVFLLPAVLTGHTAEADTI